MKKLLTVLLVIAVICTFSFGSAFAKTTFPTADTKLVAMEASDYVFDSAERVKSTGSVGITEYERAEVLSYLGDQVDNLTDDNAFVTPASPSNVRTNYFELENAQMIELVNKTIEAVKAVKTSYALDKLMDSFFESVQEIKTAEQLEVAASATSISVTIPGTTAGTYLLPGYGYFVQGASVSLVTSGTTPLAFGATFNTNLALTNWMFDNGYYTKDAMEGTAAKAALEAALVKVSTETAGTSGVASTTIYTTLTDLTPAGVAAYYEAKGYVTKLSNTAITDFDGMYDLYVANYGFEKKYGNNADFNESMLTTYSLDWYKSVNFATEMAAIQKLKPAEYLANKDKIVALAEKVLAFDDKYEYLTDLYDATYDFTPYFQAFENDADNALADATVALAGTTEVELTAADKEAFEAYVAAYDAYKAEVTKDAYVYADVVNELDEDIEAYILAGKANLAYLENDVDVAASKVDQLLNNATVKVTTVKEGKKVTVNAKVDATTMAQILGSSKVATVEYKFYHKAPGKAYKFTKTKAVNHITYTKSLKAGKNSFRVGVVLKDAKGNVVGEKSYKASTVGYRTIK